HGPVVCLKEGKSDSAECVCTFTALPPVCGGRPVPLAPMSCLPRNRTVRESGYHRARSEHRGGRGGGGRIGWRKPSLRSLDGRNSYAWCYRRRCRKSTNRRWNGSHSQLVTRTAASKRHGAWWLTKPSAAGRGRLMDPIMNAVQKLPGVTRDAGLL